MSSFEQLFNFTASNVFTPNNDGINDRFNISSQKTFLECSTIEIFDRWGVRQFASNDPVSGWDGTNSFGQRSSPGTYFYLYKINDIEFKGVITLIE